MSSQASSETGQTNQTGEKGPSEEAKTRARNLQVATGAAVAFFGASYILYLKLKADEVVGVVEVCVECFDVCQWMSLVGNSTDVYYRMVQILLKWREKKKRKEAVFMTSV